MSCGLVHIYTGPGKGKTTAAAGLAVRAVGNNLKVIFVQFIKGRASGEVKSLEMLGVETLKIAETPKFICDMTCDEVAALRLRASDEFSELCTRLSDFDMVVLDEAAGAVSNGIIDENVLFELLSNRPAECEIVLTGRDFSARLLAAADYVSEIKCIKHPYMRGISARRGIEY